MSEDKFLCGQSVHTDLIKKARCEGALNERKRILDEIESQLNYFKTKPYSSLKELEIIVLLNELKKRFLAGDKK